MTWDGDTNTVTHINGELLDPDRIYECVVLWQVAMEGIDKVTPLHEYCSNEVSVLFPHDADVGRPAKQVLVDYFGRAIWWRLIESLDGFAGLDKNKDGKITKQELADAVHKSPNMEGDLGDLVIENIMGMADLDHDGFICKNELLQVSFLSLSMFQDTDKNEDNHLDRSEVERTVKLLLGDAYDASMVDKLFDEIDKDEDGKLSFQEVKNHAKKLAKVLKI